MHLRPLTGKPRPVGTAVVSALFRENETGRVPIVAVTGTNGKTTTVNLLGQILSGAGMNLGLTSSDGISVNGRTILSGDCADAPSARRILMNPFVDAAVFEVGANSILNQGLAFDQCQVAVVTDLGSGDHLGAKYVETLEVMTKAKRTPVNVVAPHGTAVLNANDPLIAGLSSYCQGDVIYFSRSLDETGIAELLSSGKRIVSVDHGSIVLAQNDQTVSLLPVTAIPHSFRGLVEFQVENALAAIGAAWALGISPSHIVEGLVRAAEKITSCFCCFELAGATIVLSQCRNLSALNATLSAISSIADPAQRVAVYAMHDDHRPSDAFDQGLRLGQIFDIITVGGYFEPANIELRPLISEFERGVTGAGFAREVRHAAENFGDISHLAQALNGLHAQQLLLFQVKDSRHMAAARKWLSEQGASFLVNWPTGGISGTASARESTQLLTTSNDV